MKNISLNELQTMGVLEPQAALLFVEERKNGWAQLPTALIQICSRQLQGDAVSRLFEYADLSKRSDADVSVLAMGRYSDRIDATSVFPAVCTIVQAWDPVRKAALVNSTQTWILNVVLGTGEHWGLGASERHAFEPFLQLVAEHQHPHLATLWAQLSLTDHLYGVADYSYITWTSRSMLKHGINPSVLLQAVLENAHIGKPRQLKLIVQHLVDFGAGGGSALTPLIEQTHQEVRAIIQNGSAWRRQALESLSGRDFSDTQRPTKM